MKNILGPQPHEPKKAIEFIYRKNSKISTSLCRKNFYVFVFYYKKKKKILKSQLDDADDKKVLKPRLHDYEKVWIFL